MFLIYALWTAVVRGPAHKSVPFPARFEIVDTIGHLAPERDIPARTYCIIALPDSSEHYALLDPNGQITDWCSRPRPRRLD